MHIVEEHTSGANGFTFEPGRKVILHLKTNREVRVIDLRRDVMDVCVENRRLYALNRSDSYAFCAEPDVSLSFIADAARWYAGYKDIDDLSYMRELP